MQYHFKIMLGLLFLLSYSAAYANDDVFKKAANSADCDFSCYQKTGLLLSTFNAYSLSLTVTEIIHRAYQKLGIDTKVQYVPGNRSLKFSNDGHADGELFRIQGMSKIYPNLLQIPVPLLELETMAYARVEGIEIKGWSSLSPYRLGFLSGFKKAEQNTQGMQTFSAESMPELFDLLARGRLDIVIESRIGGQMLSAEKKPFSITTLEPPIDTIKIYHYLHKQNKLLIPTLSAVLRQMTASGEIDQIVQKMAE
ncbi:MAG: hypothetical protein OFPI_34920 [Osedax symbiont Rs2]|nr:MAG: hypothetical protein OFPI_34920 [Osedax symbiont Rs2]